jgi:hypothetical protein
MIDTPAVIVYVEPDGGPEGTGGVPDLIEFPARRVIVPPFSTPNPPVVVKPEEEADTPTAAAADDGGGGGGGNKGETIGTPGTPANPGNPGNPASADEGTGTQTTQAPVIETPNAGGGANDDDDDGGLSGGAIAGIVIGVVAAIGIAGFCVWYFVLRPKKIGVEGAKP